MTRVHFYRPLIDEDGNQVEDASVRVLNPGTTTLISDALYAAVSGGSPLVQPLTPPDGVIDFYLDAPRNIRLGVTVGAEPEIFFEDIGIFDAEQAIPPGILNGDVDPTPEVGQDDDYYFNKTSQKFFGPKAGGAWPPGFSIKPYPMQVAAFGDVDPSTLEDYELLYEF